MLGACSFVPRPSTPPVLDHSMQAIKTWKCRRPGNKARVLWLGGTVGRFEGTTDPKSEQ